MLSLTLRLLPFLALLGFLASPAKWLDDRGPQSAEGLTVAVAVNGMIIDPDGGHGLGGAPVVDPEPTDPDR